MKPSNSLVHAALLSLVITSPLAASDFSEMAEPAFGRSLLISAQRHNELRCAVLAFLPYRKVEVFEIEEVPFVGSEPVAEDVGLLVDPPTEQPIKIAYETPLTEPQAETLKAQILSRLASDVGDEAKATEMFEMRYRNFAPDWDFSKETLDALAVYRQDARVECTSIFEAARSDQLETVLLPAPAEPIALPDMNTCLAYDLIARKSDDYANFNFLHEDHGGTLYSRIVGPKGSKRAAREKEIAALAAGMATMNPKLAQMRLLACLPVFSIAFRN